MGLKQELAKVVGAENTSDEPEVLERYSGDYSFVKPCKPRCIVFPKNTEEVQGVLKYANDHLIPVTPRSSEVGFYAAGIPGQGGIVVDLKRMDKILHLDLRNKKVTLEPGATWEKVQTELEKQGVQVCNPLLPHRAKSVVTSALEVEPILVSKFEYSETLLTGEVVLGNGQIIGIGSAMGKGVKGKTFADGGSPPTRQFHGAQGTLGILVWANVKVEYLPKMDKIFFMPFERVEGFIEPIYMLLRRMIGRECFVLNNFNLASILAEKWPDEFESLREALPPFSLIFCLSAGERFPEEKIAYEEEAMMEVADQLHFDCLPTVGGIPGLGVRMLKIMRKPWTEEPYWKFRYKGASQDVFFLTTLNRVPDFTHAIVDVSAKYGYASKDIGIYVQPVEYGRACHCRYSFHYDPNDVREKERVHLLFLEASERAISMGGLFITPYGPWADMVYSRVPYTYSAMSKIAKEAFDPNNIMNPGKLCF